MTFKPPTEKQEKEFKKLLIKSRKAVNVVDRWLRSKGFKTEVPELKITPNWNEREKYSDDGDIFVIAADGRFRVEVKRRPDWSFESVDDIKYDTIIVNAINSWDNANPKPRFHYILNKEYTHMLIVSSKTSKKWFKEKKYDHRKKGTRWFYMCPMKYVRCEKIELPSDKAFF